MTSPPGVNRSPQNTSFDTIVSLKRIQGSKNQQFLIDVCLIQSAKTPTNKDWMAEDSLLRVLVSTDNHLVRSGLDVWAHV